MIDMRCFDMQVGDVIVPLKANSRLVVSVSRGLATVLELESGVIYSEPTGPRKVAPRLMWLRGGADVNGEGESEG